MTSIAWLILTENPAQRWRLDAPETIIGRHAGADITLPLPRLSRRHARITRTETGFTLTDLGSTNGTFINGNPLPPDTPHRLIGGDEIVLGGSVSLRFEDPEETAQGPALGKLRGVWINPETHAVWVDALPVDPPLSAAQFTLLNMLYHSTGIVTRAEIIAAVWRDADPAGVSEEAVDGLIKRLRRRLRQTAGRDYIQVVRGRGLRLLPPE